MKILYISLRFPYPPHSGDKIRTYNILKHLSQRHSISFISFVQSRQEANLSKHLLEFCHQVKTVEFSKIRAYWNCLAFFYFSEPFQVHFWYSHEMQQQINRILESGDFDLIHVQFFRMAQYVTRFNGIHKILDSCDSYALNLSRRAKLDKGISWPLLKVEASRVKNYETEIAQWFDRVTMVSALDRDCLLSVNPNIPLSVVPMGVDLEYYKPNDKEYGQNLLFTGTIKYFPNKDAIIYFYNEIFPLVKEAVPDVKFYVVGNRPPKTIKSLESNGDVVVTGWVDDVRPYFHNSAVFVCPLRSGSGMQAKILESMAMGVPVVTSSMGFEALDAVPARDIMVADDAEVFAEYVIKLLKDRDFRNRVSYNARKLVEEKYGWASVVKMMDEIYDGIVN
ncbi:glycosyltransferase [Candidatus Poribacteria bacterium]|nr:glycosyltransferase [Candidatus Poribacteria bacterium]